ncbi:MAG: amidohydrolase [Variovorax sp.]|nr:MAG: amidohydrolase [Variovorax sp.]
MNRRLDGRDEAILDPGLPIIDAHHHLFDRPAQRYMLEDYLDDVGAGHKVIASVYVETLAMARTQGPEVLRPLGEIEFANGAAAMSASGLYGPCRVAAAIVGHADLRLGEQVAPLLDRCIAAAPERFRGVRQITIEHSSEAPFRAMTHRPPAGVMRSAGFRPAFAELARRNLTFDAAVFHHQLPELGELAAAFPDTIIVLNHMGTAMGMEMSDAERAEVFRQWRDALRELARHENVMCKIGGLGLPSWGFGFEHRTKPVGYLELAAHWQPYVETAIEAFGDTRCMMESDFPPDGRSCGFVPLWNALKHITRGCSAAQKAQLFHSTAARVYRIDLAALPGAASGPIVAG